MATLAAACGDQGNVVTILTCTELYWSELVGLSVGDIYLTASRLNVRQAAPAVKSRIIVGSPKRAQPSAPSHCTPIVIDTLNPRIDNHAPQEQVVYLTRPAALLRSSN
ncbi:hypothetical protein [Mycobacterium leprae]|uniref:hypothetical protein n=1 Tax=Mycobacterium leprae TaxID=1769 RepID=UPI000AECCD8E|nr:hypothetical protein [Mycobacterium leprae]